MSSTSPTAATPSRAEDDRVYTLDDLKSWERFRPGLPPSLAVLGHPVAHSVSPQMHNAALNFLRGKDGEMAEKLKGWRYFKFEIEPAKLEEALKVSHEKNFIGLNLTLPHKMNVLSIEMVTAQIGGLGGANTLIALPSNEWRPDNTDGYGFERALDKSLKVDLATTTVILLGTGGAATNIAHSLIAAKNPLWIGGRNAEKGLNFLGQLMRFYQKPAEWFDPEHPPLEKWSGNLLVINATPLGLKAQDPLPIEVKILPQTAKIFDLVYSHGGTRFSNVARELGLTAVDGTEMLVWQGAKSLSIWLEHSRIAVAPEAIAQTMMSAACDALGVQQRKITADA